MKLLHAFLKLNPPPPPLPAVNITYRDVLEYGKALAKAGELPVLEYEHPAVDLAHGELAGSRLLGWRDQEVHHGRTAATRARPGLLDSCPQLLNIQNVYEHHIQSSKTKQNALDSCLQLQKHLKYQYIRMSESRNKSKAARSS